MVYVNARFLTQKMSGVQRFSAHISMELKAKRKDIVFVTPDAVVNKAAADVLGAVCIGKNEGHRWEQLDLPNYLRGKGSPLLVSLCNTAPLMYSNQIATHHDISYIRHPESYSKAFRYAYRLMTPILLKRIASLITVSEFSRNEISSYYRYPKEQILVAYNAVNENFETGSGPDERQRYLLAVSSPSAHKNFTRMIEAFLSLPHDHNVQLRIIGDTNSNFTNLQLHNDDRRIVFLGRVSDEELIKQYQGALAFVMPSLYEGFGIPPLEAQACGCPVIASQSAAMPEVLGDSALYFDATSVTDIASAIKRISNDLSLRQTMRQLGLSNVQRFSWELSAQKISDHIDQHLLKRTGRSVILNRYAETRK